ncbi:MAG TPA: triose-phosphate isomerase [Solirubrobacteraceae bacterium]|jgi:triosephosphate isomerase
MKEASRGANAADDRPLLGTNWKMTRTVLEAREYCRVLVGLVEDSAVDCELFVLPPYTALPTVAEILADSQIAWGAQDVHPNEDGAHTGDISGRMLAELGCRYVAVGHLERRSAYGETVALVTAKAAAAQRWGLTPIVCVGDRERISPAHAIRCAARQLALVRELDPEQLVVAYEPGWAIGTGGSPATTEWIRAVHGGIRGFLTETFGRVAGIRLISGGSVTTGNARTIAIQPNVDGLFVGRGATDPSSFYSIARGLSLGKTDGRARV